MAGFLSEEPFNVESVVGTFTFSASPKVAAMALWEMINAPGECLVAALPVRPVLFPPSPFSGTSTAPVVFPHFAAGDGWATQVILVNPTVEPIAGTLEFLGPDGRVGTSFEYAIARHSAQRFRASNPGRGSCFGMGAGHARKRRRAPRCAVVDLYLGRQDGGGRRGGRCGGLDRVPDPGRRGRHAGQTRLHAHRASDRQHV